MASSYMESKLMNSAKFGDKIESIEINKRINILNDYMKNGNIICNYDNCEYYKDNINKMHKS